jgi:hypothetical protein
LGPGVNLYRIHPDPLNAPYRDWAFERVPELVWDRYRSSPDELTQRWPALARSAKTAYSYARFVLQGPFPAGEPAIAASAQHSYLYAVDVLRGPFPAGEPAIAASPPYAFYYDTAVLRLPCTDFIFRLGYWDV